MRDSFFKHIGQTSPSPLAIRINRAKGIYLYSEDKRYIDLVSGVSVSNVGHSNPEIVAAVKEQAENYFHLMVYGEMIETPQVMHAELLTSILPQSLDCVYYLNSGSESVETALKLAKRITGRCKMISFINGYHGSTHGSLSMMGNERMKSAFRPLLPDVEHIRFNCEEDLEKITTEVACVLIEPVQGEAGVILPKNDFLSKLRKRCDDAGVMLIFDEVQTGFGRTGRMFAFERFGVVPDILVLAKALGGGMPLGAVVSSKKNLDAFTSNPMLGHITTFGGHPVSCSAALAALRILLRENWVKEVERKGEMFENLLKYHPKVKEIRRAGLLLAVDVGSAENVNAILPFLIEEGILSDYFLFHPTSFRIAPPLCIDEEEIVEASEAVIRALNRLI